jgi:hypothetical protein
VLRVRNVALETVCVDEDRLDEDELLGGTGVSAYLPTEVASPPVWASATPVALRLVAWRVLPVVDDDILLELDKVDLGVEQMPRTVRLAPVPAAGISEVRCVGLGIDGSERTTCQFSGATRQMFGPMGTVV